MFNYSFIRHLLQSLQCNNCQNLLAFGKVRGKSRVAPFSAGLGVYCTVAAVTIHTHTPTTILWPFSGTNRVSRWQKKCSCGLYGAREITEADTPTIRLGASASGLISYPPPSSPHFHARCPSCCNPPDLSWLGAGTKYAGLHTQWLGCCGYYTL